LERAGADGDTIASVNVPIADVKGHPVSDCCNCEVDTRALAARQRRVLLIVLAVNVVTFAMMVGAALLSGSSALLSGTLDNFGDAITYGLSFAVVSASPTAKARVAFLKGLLILGAAMAVAFQVGWRVTHPEVPIVETMGAAAVLNLIANAVCLRLLTPYRTGDVNMSSAWECSRNDVIEGIAVIATAGLVWLFGSAWPDIAVAAVLLALFLRSAVRVLRGAARALRHGDGAARSGALAR
jgi:Co/Zn/Cd efflux system component